MSEKIIFQNTECEKFSQQYIENLETLVNPPADGKFSDDVTVKLSEWQKEALTEIARAKGIGRSKMLRDGIMDYFSYEKSAAEAGMRLPEFLAKAVDVYTTYQEEREEFENRMMRKLMKKTFLKG